MLPVKYTELYPETLCHFNHVLDVMPRTTNNLHVVRDGGKGKHLVVLRVSPILPQAWKTNCMSALPPALMSYN